MLKGLFSEEESSGENIVKCMLGSQKGLCMRAESMSVEKLPSPFLINAPTISRSSSRRMTYFCVLVLLSGLFFIPMRWAVCVSVDPSFLWILQVNVARGVVPLSAHVTAVRATMCVWNFSSACKNASKVS